MAENWTDLAPPPLAKGKNWLERGDETTQRLGDRIVVLAHPREQKALDVAPASLHRVERVFC